MAEEDIIKKRLEKIKKGFVGKETLILLGILLVAIIIRGYYFFVTKDQALWWDSLSYGAIAHNFIQSGAYSDLPVIAGEIVIRPKLHSFFWSILLRFGAEELFVKFVLEFIPSVLSVWFVYLIGREMYDKRVGLVAAAILAVSWMHLFYGMRLLTSIPALFFSLVSVYYFLRSGKNFDLKPWSLCIFFLSLAVLTRYTFSLIAIAYLIYIPFLYKLDFLKKKSFWIGGLIGVIPLALFFLYNFIDAGSVFPAIEVYAESASKKPEFAYHILGFIPHVFQTAFFYMFLLGGLVALGKLALGWDIIKKSKHLRSHFFNVIVLILTLVFLIYLIRAGEDRYLFTAALPLYFFAALGLTCVYDFTKKYNKQIAIVLVSLIFLWGAYGNISFGDALIKNRANSFGDIKQFYIWMDHNLPDGSKVIGETSSPYLIYYTDGLIPREFPENEIPEDFELDADYLVVTAYHWHQDHIGAYLGEIQGRLEFVNGAFFDQQGQQPSVLLYKIN